MKHNCTDYKPKQEDYNMPEKLGIQRYKLDCKNVVKTQAMATTILIKQMNMFLNNQLKGMAQITDPLNLFRCQANNTNF